MMSLNVIIITQTALMFSVGYLYWIELISRALYDHTWSQVCTVWWRF